MFGNPFTIPALIGVQIGRGYIRATGHFITVLENEGDQITIGDPMTGPLTMNVATFPGPFSSVGNVVHFSTRKPLGNQHTFIHYVRKRLYATLILQR